MLDRAGGLLATKDGATVAYEVIPGDALERIGARAVMAACHEVNNAVGDGTTATAILVVGLLRRGHKLVAAGHDPGSIARRWGKYAALSEKLLLEAAIPATPEYVRCVVMSSSNQDAEMTEAVVEVMEEVGSAGFVHIEDGKGLGYEMIARAGMEVGGVRSLESTEQLVELPLVALIPSVLSTFKGIAPILESASQFPHPLLLISHGCEAEAFATVVKNVKAGLIEAYPIDLHDHPKHRQSMMDDIAALTGAVIVDDIAGRTLAEFDSAWFGSVQTATLRLNSSTLVAFENDEVETRIFEQVGKLEREIESLEFDYDIDIHKKRIAMLTGGFAVLRVGAYSEPERREKKSRLEDALSAARSAINHGVLPGGGSTLTDLARTLDAGEFSDALLDPVRALLMNAGIEPEPVIPRIGEGVGMDLPQGCLRNLLEDPAVVESAGALTTCIRKAASVAATLLTVEVAVSRF